MLPVLQRARTASQPSTRSSLHTAPSTARRSTLNSLPMEGNFGASCAPTSSTSLKLSTTTESARASTLKSTLKNSRDAPPWTFLRTITALTGHCRPRVRATRYVPVLWSLRPVPSFSILDSQYQLAAVCRSSLCHKMSADFCEETSHGANFSVGCTTTVVCQRITPPPKRAQDDVVLGHLNTNRTCSRK